MSNLQIVQVTTEQAIELLKKTAKLPQKIGLEQILALGFTQDVALSTLKGLLMVAPTDDANLIWNKLKVEITYSLLLWTGEKIDCDLVERFQIPPYALVKAFFFHRQLGYVNRNDYNIQLAKITDEDSEQFAEILNSLPVPLAVEMIEQMTLPTILTLVNCEVTNYKENYGVKEFEIAIREGLDFIGPLHILNWLQKNCPSRYDEVIDFVKEGSKKRQDYAERAQEYDEYRRRNKQARNIITDENPEDYIEELLQEGIENSTIPDFIDNETEDTEKITNDEDNNQEEGSNDFVEESDELTDIPFTESDTETEEDENE